MPTVSGRWSKRKNPPFPRKGAGRRCGLNTRYRSDRRTSRVNNPPDLRQPLLGNGHGRDLAARPPGAVIVRSCGRGSSFLFPVILPHSPFQPFRGCDSASGSLYGNAIPRKSSQEYRTPLVISQQVGAPPSSAGLPGWLYKWSLTLRWGARLWGIFPSIALGGDWWVYQSLMVNLVIPSGISRRSASSFTGSFAWRQRELLTLV